MHINENLYAFKNDEPSFVVDEKCQIKEEFFVQCFGTFVNGMCSVQPQEITYIKREIQDISTLVDSQPCAGLSGNIL